MTEQVKVTENPKLKEKGSQPKSGNYTDDKNERKSRCEKLRCIK